MRDAFGVERGDDVSKAFTLKPVGDFVKGAANALRGRTGPMTTPAGARGLAAPGRALNAVKAAPGQVKSFAQAKPKTAGAIAGGIGSAGVIGGGLGYAASGRKQ